MSYAVPGRPPQFTTKYSHILDQFATLGPVPDQPKRPQTTASLTNHIQEYFVDCHVPVTIRQVSASSFTLDKTVIPQHVPGSIAGIEPVPEVHSGQHQVGGHTAPPQPVIAPKFLPAHSSQLQQVGGHTVPPQPVCTPAVLPILSGQQQQVGWHAAPFQPFYLPEMLLEHSSHQQQQGGGHAAPPQTVNLAGLTPVIGILQQQQVGGLDSLLHPVLAVTKQPSISGHQQAAYGETLPPVYCGKQHQAGVEGQVLPSQYVHGVTFPPTRCGNQHQTVPAKLSYSDLPCYAPRPHNHQDSQQGLTLHHKMWSWLSV